MIDKPGHRQTKAQTGLKPEVDGSKDSDEADNAMRRRRLLYRFSHSGTKELDALLGGFAKAHVANFDRKALDEFETILACPSPDIYNWLSKREGVPSHLDGPVMNMMLSFKLNI